MNEQNAGGMNPQNNWQGYGGNFGMNDVNSVSGVNGVSDMSGANMNLTGSQVYGGNYGAGFVQGRAMGGGFAGGGGMANGVGGGMMGGGDDMNGGAGMGTTGQVGTGMNLAGPAGAPKTTREMYEELKRRKKGDSFTGMVVLLVMSLVALTFIGLFAWAFVMWTGTKNNIEGQVKERVAKAVKDNTNKLNAEFAEREKSPVRRFSGPVDYGELSFEFPKTWNVYLAKNASKGGDFEAYFGQGMVQEIRDENIYALRLKIYNKSLENVVGEYERMVKEKMLVARMRAVGGQNTNVYEGTLKNGWNVKVVVFGIRDKTVVMRTDAARQYGRDFDELLRSVKFNK